MRAAAASQVVAAVSPARIAYHALSIQVSIAIAIGALVAANGDSLTWRFADLAIFLVATFNVFGSLGALRRDET